MRAPAPSAALARLDDAVHILKTDGSAMRRLLANLDSQITRAAQIALSARMRTPRSPSRVIICGMGGSAIGGDVARVWETARGGTAVLINRGYTLPSFCGRNDLLIASSYSGNTEETLSCYSQAGKRRMQVVALTSGGRLEGLARKHGHPVVKVPGGQPPRTALGYLAIPLPIIIWKAKAGPSPLSEIRETAALARNLSGRFNPSVPVRNNPAKRLALQVIGRFNFLYGSQDHCDVAALRFKGQMAENAKMLSSVVGMPEMNHNEVMGWEKADILPRNRTAAVFFEDCRDHPRIAIRNRVTRSLIARKAGKVIRFHAEGKGLLARLFSLIILGDYVSYYAALARNIDPTPIASIDILKMRLAAAR